jgi:hypothetical protein
MIVGWLVEPGHTYELAFTTDGDTCGVSATDSTAGAAISLIGTGDCEDLVPAER